MTKTLRPLRRSVSPFGSLVEEAKHPFANLSDAINQLELQVEPSSASSTTLKYMADIGNLPDVMKDVLESAANDAPQLPDLCDYLIRYRADIEDKKLNGLIYSGMNKIFTEKTELFLVDHHDKAFCEKMGWTDEFRDSVLFSKERDVLVGSYFAPVVENQPGQFSEFINDWIETDSLDRLLHFFDFCLGSKNPSFEYYLLFTHPALQRVISNKSVLRTLFKKGEPLFSKVSSPTWADSVQKSLGL